MKKGGIVLGMILLSLFLFSGPVGAAPTGRAEGGVDSGLERFVTRLYETVLQRTPGVSERQDWVARLQSSQCSGAEVVAGFFLSAEYQRKNLPDSEYLADLYQAILGRSPDENGFRSWLTLLDNGSSRGFVLSGFTNSQEFQRLCAGYGVSQGSFLYQENRDRNPQATAFIQRLYRLVLGRSGEAQGLNDWSGYLLNGGGSGSGVAAAFFQSSEYRRQNTGTEAYLSDLYQAIMGRTPGEAEIAFWADWLDQGMSRDGVLAGFTGSAEFARLCASYRIAQGTYASGQARDAKPEVTALVQRMYRLVLGRLGAGEELNQWTSRLLSGSCTGTDLAVGFILSSEYQRKTVNLPSYVRMLYQALLDRTPSEAEAAAWVQRVRSGLLTPVNLIGQFTGSPEFQRLCARSGISSGAGQVTTGELPRMILYEPQLVPEMLGYVNEARAAAGLPAYRSSPELDAMALRRVQELAEDFSHTGASHAENIAQTSYTDTARVFQVWMDSEGHRRNMLQDSPLFTAMACARYQYGGSVYWVMVF